MSDASGTPDEIRADVERQREQLAETVDALHGRLEADAKKAVKPAAVAAGVAVVAVIALLVLRRRRRHGDA